MANNVAAPFLATDLAGAGMVIVLQIFASFENNLLPLVFYKWHFLIALQAKVLSDLDHATASNN